MRSCLPTAVCRPLQSVQGNPGVCGIKHLEREDILQALRYAAWRADDREILLAVG